MSKEVSIFTDKQRTIIEQMGYAHIPENHVQVLFQRADVMGLNPSNSSQIALIERDGKNGKTYTLQVGIAGLRRAARRIVKAEGGTYSESEWKYKGFDKNGNKIDWTDFWPVQVYGMPSAAKVIVTRDGDEFSHVVYWDEAVQTYRDGNPTPMWAGKPLFMLGKNAAAGAYRKAFPDELDDVYVDSERFDTEVAVQAIATRMDTPARNERGADAVRAALAAKQEPKDALQNLLTSVAALDTTAKVREFMEVERNLSEQDHDKLRQEALDRFYVLEAQELAEAEGS